ncbi:hypothetical protein [Arsenicicoccus sp. oral taxon 190]|uniref:hypothetical protein n=1 Tax=Arsenicicoccus sp. oral taxon 190 TaxID=1658671 RepID=UPI00067A391F|nr:hypothetical protein [Arsenicicoccus sp. oral taxon 190]AKT50730.1 hypothetical protein ADJ73_04345 [Arsenicicoccus sp. oral taxon 190]
MDDTTAQTTMFSSPGRPAVGRVEERVSARAAYQFALYARAALVDARRDRSTGAIHPDLAPRLVADLTGGTTPAPAPRVFVLADTDDEAASLAHQLRSAAHGPVAAVTGGFRAWVEAGLPVATA